jgi:uncharacterized membrane protein YGL010W
MRAATDLLSRYAECHRDERNITSHFVGVPMIVLGLGVALGRPAFNWAGVALSPAWVAFAGAAFWYLTRGDMTLGLAVSAWVGVLLVVAQSLAHGSTAAWLSWGAGLFCVGWLIQFLGHWYEGKKPAFLYDLSGLLVGPMFVTAEAMFVFGWKRSLMAEIQRRAGPPVLRDLARIA